MVTNTTMAAIVTNASRVVHNCLIGAKIVASGVYFVIAVRDQVLKKQLHSRISVLKPTPI